MTILVENRQIIRVENDPYLDDTTIVTFKNNEDGLLDRYYKYIVFNPEEQEKIMDCYTKVSWKVELDELGEVSGFYWKVADQETLKLTLSVILINSGIL